MTEKSAYQRVKEERCAHSVAEAKSVTVYAAFNPKTGECMLPTVRGWRKVTEEERDRFYRGCPIYECHISPLYPVEDVNKVAKKWCEPYKAQRRQRAKQ